MEGLAYRVITEGARACAGADSPPCRSWWQVKESASALVCWRSWGSVARSWGRRT